MEGRRFEASPLGGGPGRVGVEWNRAKGEKRNGAGGRLRRAIRKGNLGAMARRGRYNKSETTKAVDPWTSNLKKEEKGIEEPTDVKD